MILYRGSTKIIEQHNNEISFHFTDDYSIFDFGKMPDTIPNKGKNLAKMTSILFERLEATGAKTHFIDQITETKILVNPFQVPDVSSGYQIYKTSPVMTTVPLECIFRFGAPLGSSLLNTNPELLPYTVFDEIKIEFSTKLEPLDRKLTGQEAQEMAGLSDVEFTELKELISRYAMVLKEDFEKIDLELWDGKFEFAFGENREFILMDSIGPDELRLTYKMLPLSKEYLRQIYSGSQWHQDWKAGKRTSPKALSPIQLKTAAQIYSSITRALETGEFFLGDDTLFELRNSNAHVVVFGKGGREHALAKTLAKSSKVKQVSVIPGNPGMHSKKIKTYDLDTQKAIQFCQDNYIRYAVIGPEDLITQGLSNLLESKGIPCVAPSQQASILEASKAYAKDFMQRHSIPTADYVTFSEAQAATSYIIENKIEKSVLKKSGLAAGKGVYMCETKLEALSVIENFDWDQDKMVIEEYMHGPEVSLFVLCNGTDYKVLGTACDYKRLKDDDQGPNTGGMGCYSPANWVSEDDLKVLANVIIEPTLNGMVSDALPFKGVLFIGLMKTTSGFKVLEYNIRFGDPETQTLLPRIKSGFHELCQQFALDLPLCSTRLEFENLVSVHLVKASQNYPYKSSPSQKITNDFQESPNSEIFFAGVKKSSGELLSHGGRVLGITCLAQTKEQARKLTYSKASQIHFKGEQFRGDIAYE